MGRPASQFPSVFSPCNFLAAQQKEDKATLTAGLPPRLSPSFCRHKGSETESWRTKFRHCEIVYTGSGFDVVFFEKTRKL